MLFSSCNARQSFLFQIFALRCVWIYVFGSCFRTLSVILASDLSVFGSMCLDFFFFFFFFFFLERYQSFLLQIKCVWPYVFGSCFRTLSVILVTDFCSSLIKTEPTWLQPLRSSNRSNKQPKYFFHVNIDSTIKLSMQMYTSTTTKT